jgi:serine/threonine protein kinase
MSFLKCSCLGKDLDYISLSHEAYDLHSSSFLEHLRQKDLTNPKLLIKMEENKIFTVNKKGKTYALKITGSPMSYDCETLLKNIQHPNIVTLYDNFQFISSKKNNHCLLLEYIDGYDLFELRNKISISIPLLYEVCKQCSDALSYLHNRSIVHMDIKPENIMYIPSTNVVKLIDFGASRNTPINSLYWTGTSGFVSPECLFSLVKPPTDVLNDCKYLENIILDMNNLKKFDVWAFGITIYDMLYESLPYGETIEEEYIQMIAQLRSKNNVLLIPQTESSFYEQRKLSIIETLIKNCLSMNYQIRPFFSEILKLFD